MEKGYSLIKLDDLAYEFENAINMIFVAGQAIEKGDFEAEAYAGSLYAAHDHLKHLNSRLRDHIDALFEEVRAAEREGQNGKMSS